jgi:hypothetical protein
MSYNLTISKKDDYLHARVTGENSEENIKRYLSEVVEKAREANCPGLLIEEQLEGPRLGTLSIFDIASEGSATTRGLFRAIAYVDLSSEGNSMQFAENVAVNRGLPIRVFSTVAAAEDWLAVQA